MNICRVCIDNTSEKLISLTSDRIDVPNILAMLNEFTDEVSVFSFKLMLIVYQRYFSNETLGQDRF